MCIHRLWSSKVLKHLFYLRTQAAQLNLMGLFRLKNKSLDWIVGLEPGILTGRSHCIYGLCLRQQVSKQYLCQPVVGLLILCGIRTGRNRNDEIIWWKGVKKNPKLESGSRHQMLQTGEAAINVGVWLGLITWCSNSETSNFPAISYTLNGVKLNLCMPKSYIFVWACPSASSSCTSTYLNLVGLRGNVFLPWKNVPF